MTTDSDARSRRTDDDRTEGLGEQAYNQLILMMLRREFKPGTMLQERKLASMLDVSRTPLREALSKLASKGLIARQAGRFITVDGLDIQRLVETFSLRRMLETEFAALSAGKLTDKQVEPYRIDVRDFLAQTAPTAEDCWKIDNSLHCLIADTAGNEFAATLALDLRRLTHVLIPGRSRDQVRSGILEHLELLDAIVSGDARQARQVMDQHLANEKQAALAIALGDPIDR
jgi:DNA-binding GntR family transcriptional regulator